MIKHHPQYRFARMMVERINACVDISDVECWRHDTQHAFDKYPHGRKMVREALDLAEIRIYAAARQTDTVS